MHYLNNKNTTKKMTTVIVVYVIVLLYLLGMSIMNTETRQGFEKKEAIYRGLSVVSNEVNVQKIHSDQQIEEANIPAVSALDSRLPAVVYLRIDEASPTSPLILSEERSTDNDIAIDISNAIDSSLKYEVSYDVEIVCRKIVQREAGNQSIFGQLKIAEEVISRLRSGIYGPDVWATLKFAGYGVETDNSGNFHVYNSEGIEIVDVPETATTVTTLALRGSNATRLVLEAATALRNEQFGLELGEEYYNLGAFYHYNPDGVGEGELIKRVISRVPVSYRYGEHVFYGRWLSEKHEIDIS